MSEFVSFDGSYRNDVPSGSSVTDKSTAEPPVSAPIVQAGVNPSLESAPSVESPAPGDLLSADKLGPNLQYEALDAQQARAQRRPLLRSGSNEALPAPGERWPDMPGRHVFFAAEPTGAFSRACVYARESTDMQQSIPDQVRAAVEWSKQQSSPAVYVDPSLVYADRGVSGKKVQRPEYQRLIRDAENKKFNVVIAFKSNRIGRNRHERTRFMSRMRSLQVRVVFVSQHLDTSTTKETNPIWAVHGFVDELGASANTEAIQQAQVGLFLRGVVLNRPPFGYSTEDIPGEFTKTGAPLRRLIPDEVAKKVLQYVYELAASRDITDVDIARHLATKGVPPPPGCRRWSGLHAGKLLTDRRYIGEWSHGRYEHSFDEDKDRTSRVKRSEPLASKFFPDRVLISPELFEKVQARRDTDRRHLSGRQRKKSDLERRPRVLRGLLWCPKHRRRLVCSGGVSHSYYFCSECIEDPNRLLINRLNGPLATRLICQKVGELLAADSELMRRLTTYVESYFANLPPADMSEITQLRKSVETLSERILDLRYQAEMETSELIRSDTEALISRLAADRERQRLRLTVLEERCKERQDRISTDQILLAASRTAELLSKAALETDPVRIAEVREILKLFTAGRIEVHQRGDPASREGFLVGSFVPQVIAFLAKGRIPSEAGFAAEPIEVEFKDLSMPERIADEVFGYWQRGETVSHAARAMGIDRSTAMAALKHYYRSRGQEPPTERECKSRGGKKNRAAKLRRRTMLANRVGPMYDSGEYSGAKAIARELGKSACAVRQAIRLWSEMQGRVSPNLRSEAQRQRARLRAGQSTTG